MPGRCTMAALQTVVLLSSVFVGFSQCVDIQPARLSREDPLIFRGLVRRQRHVDEQRVTCAEDEYRHSKSHCCKKCSSGFRMVADCPEKDKITACEPCPEGQFLDKPNYSRKCQQCFECTQSLGQVTISNCTGNRNTVCGCPSGQFKVEEGESFKCQNCSQCNNGKAINLCHDRSDTLCSCNFGFFFDELERKCQHCETCEDTECQDHCPPAGISVQTVPQKTNFTLYVLLGVGVLVVLIICGTILYIRKKPSMSGQLTGSQRQETGLPDSTMMSETLIDHITQTFTEQGLQHESEAVPHVTMPLLEPPDITSDARAQQFHNASEYYFVIDSIPVSRWREFARRLGLSDNDIECCELKNRLFRDAQYDMLMSWRQHVGPSGATKEAVIGVLKEMNLMGPIEVILEGRQDAGS